MENRSSSEIAAAVLSACQGGARISHIQQEAALTHSQARAYLSELLLAGYLALDAGESTHTLPRRKVCSI
jgi:predicted transcriptional regulator